jgi:protein-S-isoprenylcysteine O-methyltransferase Ste14
MAIVVLVSGIPPQWPAWISLSGLVFVALGAYLFAHAVASLGRSMTVFPEPRRTGVLVENGPYRYARHPIYGGGLLIFFGIGLISSVWAVAATAVLAYVWVGKSREEERRLSARFPGYEDYRRRVRRRFIPFLY